MSSVRLDADEVLSFREYSKIYLRTRDAVTYSGVKRFSKEKGYKPGCWHLVTVNHNEEFFKDEILEALFEAMKDTVFAPVGYIEGKIFDKFLIPSNVRKNIKNLFKRELRLSMPSGKPLHLSVSLDVANYSSDQISIEKVLWNILDKGIKNLEDYQGVKNVLNLEKVSGRRECFDICLSLGNPLTLRMLFEILVTSFTKEVKTIKGIVLKRNDIFDLTGFKVLFDFIEHLELLDLRHNDIPQEAVASLGSLKVKNLFLSKNKLTLSYDVKCLFAKELPNVEQIDGEVLPREKVTVKSETNQQVLIMWHQVFIRHERKFDKTEVLKFLFKAVNNELEPLYPCFYQQGFEEDSFLVKKCEKQLMHLENLGVIDPIGAIRVQWDCRPVEENEMNIKQETLIAIKSGYDLVYKTLNLTEFAASNSLKYIEVFLGNSNVLNELIDYATKLYNNPQEVKFLNLSHNEIRNIPPLTHFKYLTAIDLSFNNLQTTESLEPLKALGKYLKTINLHGNPVCAMFFTSHQYVQCLFKILPNLTTIDSQAVNPKDFLKDECFSSKKNYLCTLDGYDFVEFFVETFFTTWNFESDQAKTIVENFYHKNASLTYSFDFNEKSFKTPRYELNIRKNRKLSRNFIVGSNNKDFLYCGHHEISSFYKEIGSVFFDTPTFATDLAVFNENLVVIVVTGLLTEKSLTKDANVLFSFSRTFVLKPAQRNVGLKGQSTVYKIVNDLWSTSSPTIKQSEQYKSSWEPTKPEINWKPNSIHEQSYFISMMQQITDLKPEKCEQALSSNNWDFMETLEKYETLLSEGQVNDEHFLIPTDQIELPYENEGDLNNTSGIFANDVPLTPILPPMPICVKVDPIFDDTVSEVATAQIPLPLPRRVVKQEDTLELTDQIPKPKISVKNELFPDIKPNVFVKTENIQEPVKAKALIIKNDLLSIEGDKRQRPLTIRNDQRALTIRNDLLAAITNEKSSPEKLPQPLTVKTQIMPSGSTTGNNEDDISTDEERDDSPKNVNDFLEDFYMENVSVLPKPGSIKCEVLNGAELATTLPVPGSIKTEVLPDCSEPMTKKIKVEEIPIVKTEKPEWHLPFTSLKKEN
ncbi:hypothetical protein ACFFRR_010980 [Megaselia abdita]